MTARSVGKTFRRGGLDIMTREELNHKAYTDVLDCKDPSMPDNEVYMECYRAWRPLQPQFKLDDWCEADWDDIAI